jgi:hypothetical protein
LRRQRCRQRRRQRCRQRRRRERIDELWDADGEFRLDGDGGGGGGGGGGGAAKPTAFVPRFLADEALRATLRPALLRHYLRHDVTTWRRVAELYTRDDAAAAANAKLQQQLEAEHGPAVAAAVDAAGGGASSSPGKRGLARAVSNVRLKVRHADKTREECAAALAELARRAARDVVGEDNLKEVRDVASDARHEDASTTVLAATTIISATNAFSLAGQRHVSGTARSPISKATEAFSHAGIKAAHAFSHAGQHHNDNGLAKGKDTSSSRAVGSIRGSSSHFKELASRASTKRGRMMKVTPDAPDGDEKAVDAERLLPTFHAENPCLDHAKSHFAAASRRALAEASSDGTADSAEEKALPAAVCDASKASGSAVKPEPRPLANELASP